MQRLNTSFKFVNSKCDNFSLLIQNVIISVCLLCVGGLSLITSDQEDESIWKILAVEN